ncbi:PREDICTED: MD-2-related lipid-recognition protein-like [Vollenhovia emeryi]|uniref:MD-2-related lipid-recognition protein-like n=1 Tax=Vollenhovia emeryi TaxID=411798 RepID=UPI0005F3C16E|nr:PREDICTED: MD-2-related lipid-recognition protein-like [Vollenhovia emeryi]
MCRPTLTSTFFHLATNHRPLKMNRNVTLATVVLILALSAVYAELVQWTPCPPSTEEQCTIHEVHVDPCREAEERKPCSLKKGRNASISFEYTPQFTGSLQSRAYWASEIVDLPFLGMPVDACLSTTCPASVGQRQSYSVLLPISKKFPARTYDLKWKLWNEQEQMCCFMFQIKLVK